MEAALRNYIEQNIPELIGEIYPTNAPEEHSKPYLVYIRISTVRVKTLAGLTSKQYLSFMFNIMAKRYSEMKSLTKRVEDMLIILPGTTLGHYYIEDIDINNVKEQYEHELKVNRGIIDFTIYFEEVE